MGRQQRKKTVANQAENVDQIKQALELRKRPKTPVPGLTGVSASKRSVLSPEVQERIRQKPPPKRTGEAET